MKKILLIAVLIGAMFSVSAYVVCVAAPLFGKSIKGCRDSFVQKDCS